MRVLEAPQTWIAAAAVLVLIAVVLIALAPRRRRRAPDTPVAAPAAPAAGPPPEEDPDTDPVSLGGARVPPAGGGDDAVTAPALPSGSAPVTGLAPRPEAEPGQDADPDRRYRPAAADDLGTEASGRPRPTPSPRPVAAEAAGHRENAAVPDPARTSDRAKDRLLAALLPDHQGAVDVLAAMPEDGPASGEHAAALLRTGLSPAQVAGLCGVEQADLADLVARELGLLDRPGTAAQDPAPDRGDSRTDVPGRAWASAGSAAGSTTPTTG